MQYSRAFLQQANGTGKDRLIGMMVILCKFGSNMLPNYLVKDYCRHFREGIFRDAVNIYSAHDK